MSLPYFEITGGSRLRGTVRVSGAKNAALLALRILSIHDQEIETKLEKFKKEQKDKILGTHLT